MFSQNGGKLLSNFMAFGPSGIPERFRALTRNVAIEETRSANFQKQFPRLWETTSTHCACCSSTSLDPNGRDLHQHWCALWSGTVCTTTLRRSRVSNAESFLPVLFLFFYKFHSLSGRMTDIFEKILLAKLHFLYLHRPPPNLLMGEAMDAHRRGWLGPKQLPDPPKKTWLWTRMWW